MIKVVQGEPALKNTEKQGDKPEQTAAAGANNSSNLEGDQALPQELSQSLPPDIALIWRCTCGKEMDRFCPAMTKHIRNTRESGEPHRWALVDKKTHAVYANSIAEARYKHLTATPREDPPRLAGEKDQEKAGRTNKDTKKDADKEIDKYKPTAPMVVKYVSATDELPGELLLLYKLFVDRCIAMAKEPPTRGEWVTQTISQFYMEHAEDFDIKGMAGDFISKTLGG